MKSADRDLLVLLKNEFDSEEKLEREIELLNELLFHYETLEVIASTYEIIDLNKHKILEALPSVQLLLKQKKLKPFQFAYNKN